MKRSNLIILTAALLFIAVFAGGSALNSRYVSRAEFDRNQAESITSFDISTYNYRSTAFDSPFDEIVICDSSDNTFYVGHDRAINTVQWVQSAQTGVKTHQNNHKILNTIVKDRKLHVYIHNLANRSSGNGLIVYSPSLRKITVENARGVTLMNTTLDSLSIVVKRADLTLAPSTSLSKLDVVATDMGTVFVKTHQLSEARYDITSSGVVRSQIDSCGTLYIKGDSTGAALLSPMEDENGSLLTGASTYGILAFDDDLYSVSISNTVVHRILGNPEQMTLNMTVPQIERTLANVVEKTANR